MKEITLEELELELMEDEIKEHLLVGSFLVYIPCLWTINTTSLLNRELFRWHVGHPIL